MIGDEATVIQDEYEISHLGRKGKEIAWIIRGAPIWAVPEKEFKRTGRCRFCGVKIISEGKRSFSKGLGA